MNWESYIATQYEK